MLEKLKEIEEKYEKIGLDLSTPEIISNQKEFQKLMKQHNSMEEVVNKYRKYKAIEKAIADIREIIEIETDKDMKLMAGEELSKEEKELIKTEEELKRKEEKKNCLLVF